MLVPLAAAALLAGCGAEDAAEPPQGSEPANLDPADFVDTIDHPVLADAARHGVGLQRA